MNSFEQEAQTTDAEVIDIQAVAMAAFANARARAESKARHPGFRARAAREQAALETAQVVMPQPILSLVPELHPESQDR